MCESLQGLYLLQSDCSLLLVVLKLGTHCNVTAYRNTVSWQCGQDSWPRNVSKFGYAVTLRACSVRCRYLAVASKGWYGYGLSRSGRAPWHVTTVCSSRLLAPVTNSEPHGVTLAGYCYGMRHGMKVQTVTPYRVSHLQRYGVTVRGNVTSAYKCAASREIPHALWNPKLRYRFHKYTPPASILSQLNRVHTPTYYLLKINLNIILPSTLESTHWSLSVMFPHQNPVHAFPLCHPRCMPRPFRSRFYHPHNSGWGVQIMELLNMKFSPLPCSSSLLGLTILRNTPFSNTLSPWRNKSNEMLLWRLFPLTVMLMWLGVYPLIRHCLLNHIVASMSQVKWDAWKWSEKRSREGGEKRKECNMCQIKKK
jgi:hypothetical protein